MSSSLFGREGFTADSVIHLIQATALNPLLTGSLLYALQHLPPSTLAKLSLKARNLTQSRKTNKTLLVLLALGVLRRVNNFLSQGALNNWQSSGFSDVKKELAIVTGGSSGIGEQISLELARKGVKVIILDVQAPKSALRMCIQIFCNIR
jgi:all-trans-retinol dehydrogenase (NAD+)